MSQIVWGGHVVGLEVSTGWLLVNGLRLQDSERAIYPAPELDERFVEDLRYAGPDLYDAESLRALFGRYSAIAYGQSPEADGGAARSR